MVRADGGGGVEELRREYEIERVLAIPGRSRRLLALLGRVMHRMREAPGAAAALSALGVEITVEIVRAARVARASAGERLARR